MAGSARRTTLKDVALEAGVSTMSVSKALNNKHGVSEATKKRIFEAVKKLNYTPNSVAQSLRSSKTNTIGVVMSDSSPHVFSDLLQGVSKAASDSGYGVLLTNTGQDQDREKQAIDLLISKRIDGLIVAAPVKIDAGELERVISMGIPIIFMMRAPQIPGIDYVINDNYFGGIVSARHLYEKGARDFYFITMDSHVGRERMRGYTEYLAQQNMDTSKMPVYHAKPQIQDGYDAMREILDKGITSGAVCAGCDMIAIGAMSAILNRGLRIPEDFRLMGYDDIDLAGYLRVPLTTIRQPIYDIGVQGVQLLLNRMEEPKSPYQSLVLQPQLIERHST